jgi:hypothetical protein
MLKGFWPGDKNKEMLTQFITLHFDDSCSSYNTYVRWLKKERSSDPLSWCNVWQ